MADWPIHEGAVYSTLMDGMSGFQLTASATLNTKGAYVQISASTPSAAQGLWLSATNMNAADFLIDLAAGAAGSEQIVAGDLHQSSGNGIPCRHGHFFLPVHIPAGTRLSARCQATVASALIRVAVVLMAQGWQRAVPLLGRITAYGQNTADSGAVQVDPGGVANTKGAYSQIVASTTNPLRALLVNIGNQANTVRTDCSWLLDIAAGAASSEQIIIPDLMLSGSSATDTAAPGVRYPIPVHIPAGTRLAARAQCSITDATDRLFDVQLVGID